MPNKTCCLCVIKNKSRVQKASKRGKNRRKCITNCKEEVHWWCSSCAAAHYRNVKLNTINHSEEEINEINNGETNINNLVQQNLAEPEEGTISSELLGILFDDEPRRTSKRGRPPKKLDELSAATVRKKFKKEVNEIEKSISLLNSKSCDNNWQWKLQVEAKIVNQQTGKTYEIIKGEEEEDLENLVKRIAFAKIRCVSFSLSFASSLTPLQ